MTQLNAQAGSTLGQIGWREFISKSGSTQTSRWVADGSQIEMSIDSNWSNRENVINQTLGYCYRSGNQLCRFTPMRHPDYYWLFATSTVMNGVNWTSKFVTNYGAVSQYDLNRTHITFSMLPFDVYEDGTTGSVAGVGGVLYRPNQAIIGAGGGEWNRYVVKLEKPTAEFAQTNRNVMQFMAGTPVPAANQNIPNSVGYKLGYSTITWKWMWVPDDYLCGSYQSGSYTGRKINIENAIGTVNSAAFPPACAAAGLAAGYPAETLYLDSVDYEPVNLPVDPVNVLGYPIGKPPRVWNVILNFKFFNDVPFLDPGYAYGHRGWQLAPSLANPIPNTNPNYTGGFYWYPITPQVNPGANNTLYTASDFTKIFTAV